MQSISWPLFHSHTLVLTDRLLEANVKPDTVVAITRGGLIPAAIVARRLGVRMIETVCVQTYEGQDRGEPVVLKKPAVAGKALVVDDLVDSGATAKAVRELLPDAVIAVVYSKPAGRPFADFVGVERERNDEWIIFPWEA